jgi:uncharacterized protein YkwD
VFKQETDIELFGGFQCEYATGLRPVACTCHDMCPSYRRASTVWFLVLASACATPASPSEVPDSAAAEAAGGLSDIAGPIVRITNAERANTGLPALRTSSRLMEAAQLHADQMARLGRLEHVLSGGRYPKPEDRLAAADYQWSSYAENIAMGQTSAAGVMDSWMRSSGHRANILSPNNTEIGIGFARDSRGRPYYVQVFGRPR